MRVRVTLTAEKPNRHSQMKTVAKEIFIEGSELIFQPNGTVLEIFNPMSGATYITDFAYSGVAAVLDAAPVTGGHFLLT